MTKKQTVVLALVIMLIGLIFTASIWLIWKYFISDNSSSSESLSTSVLGESRTLNPSESENISLEPKANESGQADKSSLKVDNSQSNSSNLGSGSRQITSSSSGTAKQEDFSQYEQYKDKNEVYFGDIVVGTGAEAIKDSQLAVTYKGYLTNGQVFDQSRPANNGQLQPFLFTLGAGKVIPGFEQGIAGMKVGGSRRLIIPPSLGYGANAQGSIPANSVLVFDIQLMTVQ